MSQSMQDGSDGLEPRPGPSATRLDAEALRVAVEENAASALFPALAETYRRAGRLDQARRVAEAGLAGVPENTAGRVVLALTLLDGGQVESAREQLARAISSLQVAPQPLSYEPLGADRETESFDASLDDDEIDCAFDAAEAQPDEMLDANKVVEQALRREDLHAPEGDLSIVSETFATRTMAELLESQGDVERANAIRSSLSSGVGQGSSGLDAAEVPSANPAEPVRDRHSGDETVRILGTLETWLQNIRRGAA